MNQTVTASQLIAYLDNARERTLRLVRGLNPEQLMGPRLPIVNPMRWELGHLAWFHEYWILRKLDGRPPLLAQADALYDSSTVDHDRRWDLPLPSIDDTLDYMKSVQDALRRRLLAQGDALPERDIYFHLLATFHEDMHAEAFTYMRQTLAYPAPEGATLAGVVTGALPGDVEVPGGSFLLGANPEDGFLFDNEKWAHPVTVGPFCIARAPVTNSEFLQFVEDDGYRRPEFWDESGRSWLALTGLHAPVYWRCDSGRWLIRHFDQWNPPQPHAPVTHVSWHEAQAWCRWAHRRLPTEAEWEMAAACEPGHNGSGIATRKRRFPWGDEVPTSRHANLDGAAGRTVGVAAAPEGDSAFGCRQMIGNVWEWTASTFTPYPGFSPDPYHDYSVPWFGSRKVLRGGSWATPARLLRNTWRNFFTPERNDIFAGFRTCAL